MDGPTVSPLTYRARLHGGPGHGRRVSIRAGSSGGPSDLIQADEEGVYALAGAPDRDGALAYGWMRWTRAAALRHVLAGGSHGPGQR